jgi:uncharacterized protein YecE (DUF72 family)
MTKDTFVAKSKTTHDNFEFLVKVPEMVTHYKQFDVNKGAV